MTSRRQPKGFICYITADGKGMVASNHEVSKKCWLCNVADSVLEQHIMSNVRYGAFLGTIPFRPHYRGPVAGEGDERGGVMVVYQSAIARWNVSL
jgi:hypothetical protein